MPRAKTKPSQPNEELHLVPAKEVARRLGISLSNFDRFYSEYFTDRRPVKLRTLGRKRLYLSDEIDLFLREGAEALIAFRRNTGRAPSAVGSIKSVG